VKSVIECVHGFVVKKGFEGVFGGWKYIDGLEKMKIDMNMKKCFGFFF